MKRLSFLLLALLPALPLGAQELDTSAERARIEAQRADVDARFAAEENACRGRFAVNDCTATAKARQRDALAELRRQEIHLNAMDRKRRAAERQRAVDERQSAERHALAARRRAEALQEQEQREARAAAKAASKLQADAHAQENKSKAQGKQARPSGTSPEEAEARRLAHDKRLAEAREHRAKSQKRLAERDKPPAQPLPVPP